MNLDRKVSRRTPVYDHADQLLFLADREKAIQLMQQPQVETIGTVTRVKGLRFRGPDPALLSLAGSRARRPVGTPHRNESYWNVRGVWHIDRIPVEYQPHFALAV